MPDAQATIGDDPGLGNDPGLGPLSFGIEAVFDAPVDTLWQAWTTEQMHAWACPDGYAVEAAEAEVREGGRWSCHMRHPSEGVRHVQGTYVAVAPPHRLVLHHQWLRFDPMIGPADPPSPQTLVTVTFTPDGPTRTRMTFLHAGFWHPASCAGHEQGWRQGFERLKAFLG
ncbi:MAG: SRPBCC domain-containing protein [Cyanobacteria bacterium HKST-UBA06]|nr:SRPBCC domain-containing protein [Cyanobacteria bacterium HKST-UBA06]